MLRARRPTRTRYHHDAESPISPRPILLASSPSRGGGFPSHDALPDALVPLVSLPLGEDPSNLRGGVQVEVLRALPTFDARQAEGGTVFLRGRWGERAKSAGSSRPEGEIEIQCAIHPILLGEVGGLGCRAQPPRGIFRATSRTEVMSNVFRIFLISSSGSSSSRLMSAGREGSRVGSGQGSRRCRILRNLEIVTRADAPTVSAAFAFAFPLAAAARPRFLVGKTSVTFAVVGMLSCASEVSALAGVPKVVVVLARGRNPGCDIITLACCRLRTRGIGKMRIDAFEPWILE